MASHITLTILFGFVAVFWCLQLLDATSKVQASRSRSARLVAGVFLSAVPTTFALTLLLLFAYVRALGRANAAAGGAGGRFLVRLAKATLVAAIAALLTGTALRLVADGYLGGADDVGWLLYTK